jgi:hypothetical protein
VLDAAAPRRRWGRRAEAPTAGERTAGAAEGMGLLLARIVRLVALVVCAIIALAAIFIVLDANATNSIVSTVRDWGKTLVGPFDGVFHLSSAKGTVALNYGIAIVVYSIVAWLIARLLLAPAGAFGRRRVEAEAGVGRDCGTRA